MLSLSSFGGGFGGALVVREVGLEVLGVVLLAVRGAVVLASLAVAAVVRRS